MGHVVLSHQFRRLWVWVRPVVDARLRADQHSGKQVPLALALEDSQLFLERRHNHVLNQTPHF